MVRNRKAFGLLALGASPFALLDTPAQAQAVAPPPAETGAETPEPASAISDIIVTAQRRSESLKDVPISIQAVTGEQIAREGVVSTQDLAGISPTVNFSSGNSANATAFSLRGVSSVAVQSGIQPSTAMVLDGVALAKQGEFVADLADIERIEVLNGPQGTLFGKNSTAGVINIVTKQPIEDFEAMIEGLATTDEEFSVRAMVNVPLSQGARLRVNGFYRDQSPLVDNLTGRDAAGAEAWGVSGKLGIDLSDTAEFVLAASYSRINSSYGALANVGPTIFGAQQLALGVPIGRGLDTINTDLPAIDIVKTTRVTGTLNWDVSDTLSFVSITNYSHFSEMSVIDSDGTPTGANVGTGEALPASTYPFKHVSVGLQDRFPIRYTYYSQEARANYTSGPVTAVFGLYYQHYKDFYQLNLPFNFDGALLGATPGERFYAAQVPQARLKDTTASIFGDITYAVTDQFKLFGGLRYTHEKVGVVYHRDDFFGPYALYDPVTGVFSGAPVNTVDTVSEHKIDNLSGRVGLQYQPTTDLNFYASYARGYKAPAADVSQTLAAGVDPIIDPEIADAFEVGAKLRVFDDRLALNVAVFHEEINGIQEAINPPNSPTLDISLVNAGKLKTRGFEGDMQLAVTPEFRLSGGLAYVKATYSGFAFNCNSTQLGTGTCPNDPKPGFQDITGQQAIGSPKWKYSLAADYEDQFAGSDLSYYAHVNWTWASSIQYALGDDPLTREPSHGMLNASIGLKGPKDRWEVQIFGKNLTNDFYYASLLNFAVIGQPVGFFPRDFKRYGGVKLTVRY